jgi:hypothetical protein
MPGLEGEFINKVLSVDDSSQQWRVARLGVRGLIARDQHPGQDAPSTNNFRKHPECGLTLLGLLSRSFVSFFSS